MSKQNQKPNSGGNRQQRRQEERRPQHHSASKPIGLRIAIVAVMLIMLLGFVIVPLIR